MALNSNIKKDKHINLLPILHFFPTSILKLLQFFPIPPFVKHHLLLGYLRKTFEHSTSVDNVSVVVLIAEVYRDTELLFFPV